MGKRRFAIYSVLVVAIVLLAVLVPSCGQTYPTYPSDLEIKAFAGGFAPWTPLYMIQVYPDGSAVYSQLAPENRGTATWTQVSSFSLTVDQMSAIWDTIVVNNFFSLEQNYSTPAADGSFAVMNITANGVTHTVLTQNTKVVAFDSVVITINDATPGDLDLFYYAIHPQCDLPSNSTVTCLATSTAPPTTVTIEDCKITVTVNIELQGPLATPDLAKKVKEDFKTYWNQGEPHTQCKTPPCLLQKPGCSVKFDAVVEIGNGTAREGYHQIRVVNRATATYQFSFVWKNLPTPNRLPTPNGNQAGSGEWFDNAGPKVYAHEAGHLMGENDTYIRYRFGTTTQVPELGPFLDDDWTKPLPNHTNDMMASIHVCNETPRQDAIDRIVSGVTCPCDCCPKPITGDASIEFDTWTINGQPVPPGTYEVPPSTIIDFRYKVHVAGPPGAVVQIIETSWLLIHYVSGEAESIWLHAVNAPGAVSMDPPATKLCQMTIVGEDYAEYCTRIPLPKCEPVWLGVETEWTLAVCTDYIKTINWLHIGEVTDEEVLFDLQALPGENYTLYSYSSVELEGDENPENNDTGWSPLLTIVIVPPP